jgi:hypothetical protein
MEEGVRPIKASEILKKKAETIPAAMVQAVNELIAKKWNGSQAVIRKDELLERYFEITGESNDRANRDKVYDKRYMDFESMYRQEGWVVKYSSPSYGDEDYEPYFTFTIDKVKQANE